MTPSSAAASIRPACVMPRPHDLARRRAAALFSTARETFAGSTILPAVGVCSRDERRPADAARCRRDLACLLVDQDDPLGGAVEDDPEVRPHRLHQPRVSGS